MSQALSMLKYNLFDQWDELYSLTQRLMKCNDDINGFEDDNDNHEKNTNKKTGTWHTQ